MVDQFQLSFIALHLFLFFNNLSTGAVLAVLLVVDLYDTLLGVVLLRVQIDCGVVLLRVELLDGLSAFSAAGLSELTDVAGERFSEHFRVKSRELFE